VTRWRLISGLSISGLWVPVAAFLLTWLISLTPPYQRLDLWLGDAQQRMVAPEMFFQDALLIDLDDASLKQLKPYFGTWPYERDVYAVVLDYLSEMGAEKVVFDLVLADPRPKDDFFARSMQRNGNAVLIANALSDRGGMDTKAQERLRQFSWQVPSSFPVTRWPTLLMPTPVLTGGLSSRIQLGMISVVEDADGVLRHLSLMHDIDGIRLPSLPLATLAYTRERQISHDAAHDLVRFGTSVWPVDDEGRVHLAFPKNANAVLTMPFQQVAEAALGLVHLDNAPGFFKGKTVFIGSTANLSDRIVTPRGPMSGTLVLAIARQSLKHNLLLTPQRSGWNGMLIALGLLPTILASLVFSHRPRSVVLSVAGTIVCLYALNLLLWSYRQESVLLFPLLLVGTGSMLGTIRHQIELRAERDKISATLFEQGRFMDMLTHELKTPISVVRMALDAMKVQGPLKGHIDRALEDMDDIVERCRQVDKLEQHKLIPYMQCCQMDEILVELRSGSWAPDRLFITPDPLSVTPPLPELNTDPQLLRIILGNLISNAIKYSPPETLISIHAEPAPHLGKAGIRVSVQNQPGTAGVPDPEQVFDKYYRSSGAHSKTGSGLGLYLVRSITELLGGQIEYAVVQEKVRFTLWIPC
jgi:signal transduction histidine kinase